MQDKLTPFFNLMSRLLHVSREHGTYVSAPSKPFFNEGVQDSTQQP